MRKLTVFSSLTIWLIVCSVVYGGSVPDSCRAILLSDRVGEVISAEEGVRYNLFTQIKGFSEAVVIELPDSTCGVLFKIISGAEFRDTLIRSTWPAIFVLAEKIEHFQELENGEYVMGSTPPRLRYAALDPAGSPRFVPPRGVRYTTPAVLSWKEGDDPGADSVHLWPARISHRAEDILPLGFGPGLTAPRRYPSLAVAVGIRTISPDFSGLNVGPLGPNNVSVWPLLNVAPELLVTREIGIQIDYGFSLVQCATSGATVVLYAHPFDDPGVRPFLEAGGVWTYIHAPLSGRGDPAIYVKTSAGGVRGGIGIEFVLENSVGIVLDASYEHIAEKSDVFTDYTLSGQGPLPQGVPVSVDLSSLRFGIRLKFQ